MWQKVHSQAWSTGTHMILYLLPLFPTVVGCYIQDDLGKLKMAEPPSA